LQGFDNRKEDKVMTAQPSLLDWTPGAAEKERDKALEKVMLNSIDYGDKAIEIIKKLRWELGEFIAEEMTLEIYARLGPPHSPNLFGSIIMRAVREGWIKKTGRYAPMLKKSSHGRESKTYVGVDRVAKVT
jgi:hypothetical protein